MCKRVPQRYRYMTRNYRQASNLLTCLALLALTWSTQVAANDAEPTVYEWRFGALMHDYDLWAHERRESGFDINSEVVFGRLPVDMPAGTLRPNFGVSLSTAGDTSRLYGGVLWQFGERSGPFLDLGIGLAVHDGDLDNRRRTDRKRLGSRVLFRIPLEVGYSFDGRHQLSVMFDHISNGYLAKPNEGMDSLGLRYGYRF